MDRLPQLRQALIPAVVFLFTGLSIASMFLLLPRGAGLFATGYRAAGMLTVISTALLLFACVLLFFRPHLGYLLGAIAALLALPWFILTESSCWDSSWHYLNGPDQFSAYYRPVAILRILSVALLATAVACSVLRLLPSVLPRKFRISGRTWPAIVVGVAVPFAWLCHSAMPWMLPGIVDRGTSGDMWILHVEKRGLRFHETNVGINIRDARFGVSEYDRRLFQYRFEGSTSGGAMPETIRQRAADLVHSPTLGNLRTRPPIALRSWNAEGWYIRTGRVPVRAFTSEYGTTAPTELIDLLKQILKLPAVRGSSFAFQDICLGFCYDPLAGLGFVYSNDRCTYLPDGTTRCF